MCFFWEHKIYLRYQGSNSEQEQQEADNYDNKGLTSSRDSKRAKATIAQAHDMKVITRQFSAFDRQNELSAASTFHGFYVLFWIAVAVLIVKVSADNWRQTGNPFGHNELLKYMFARDGKCAATNPLNILFSSS